MKRYHINPKIGEVRACRARKRCPFGDLEADHYDSPEDARAAYEEAMGSPLPPASKAGEEALSSLPQAHRNVFETSDAFYNTLGKVDSQALQALAAYHYHRSRPLQEKEERDLAAMRAKKFLLSTPGGSSYQGWPWDPHHLVEGEDPDPASIVLPAPTPLEAKTLQDFSEVREEGPPQQALSYVHESLVWLSRLTPREHNSVAYWTGPGATVTATTLRGEANPWNIQQVDPEGEDYWHPEQYMEDLRGAFSKLPAGPKRVFYRGLNEDILGKEVVQESFDGGPRPLTLAWAEEHYPLGKEVEFPLPQSSSHTPHKALGFSMGRVLLEVEATRAAPTGVVSAWGASEGEYLLPPDATYRVKAVGEGVPYRGRNGDLESCFVIQLEQASPEESPPA